MTLWIAALGTLAGLAGMIAPTVGRLGKWGKKILLLAFVALSVLGLVEAVRHFGVWQF